jgi:pimeloyl-ACP methyl ester carboxylesterase
MRSTHLLLATLLLPAMATAEETHWLGTLDVGAARLRLQININESADGYSGVMISLDQGKSEIELDTISLDSGRVDFTVKKIGASYKGNLSADEKLVEGTFTQGGQDLPLTFRKVDSVPDDKLLESWVGTLQTGGQSLRLQFRLLEQPDGKHIAKFDSLSQDVKGLPAELEITGKHVRFEVKVLKAVFDGTLNEDGTQVSGEWNQGVPLPMTFQKVEVAEDLQKRRRPQTPKEPFPYDIRNVSFRSLDEGSDVVLDGTLTLPRTSKPHTAVVLVSGSGPQDRDETLLQHKPFHVIADHLTRNGIAVLRYDDRGFGRSTGDHAAATTIDFANDAAGAVAFLRSQAEINGSRIGVVGHSEGGIIAPLVAVDDPELAFIVLLSGSGVPGIEILEKQSTLIGEAEGMSEESIAASNTMRNAVIKAIQKADVDTDMAAIVKSALESARTTIPEDQRAQFESDDANIAVWQQLATPWMGYFFSYDPATTLEKVQCPVLVLTGDLDLQVWHEQNIPAIEEALQKADVPFRTVVFPKLNHLFQPAKTGAVSEYVEIEITIDPLVLKEITHWIQSLYKPSGN